MRLRMTIISVRGKRSMFVVGVGDDPHMSLCHTYKRGWRPCSNTHTGSNA